MEERLRDPRERAASAFEFETFVVDLNPLAGRETHRLVAPVRANAQAIARGLAQPLGNDRAVVAGPLKRRGAGRPWRMNFHAIQAIVRAGVTAPRADRAGIGRYAVGRRARRESALHACRGDQLRPFRRHAGRVGVFAGGQREQFHLSHQLRTRRAVDAAQGHVADRGSFAMGHAAFPHVEIREIHTVGLRQHRAGQIVLFGEKSRSVQCGRVAGDVRAPG